MELALMNAKWLMGREFYFMTGTWKKLKRWVSLHEWSNKQEMAVSWTSVNCRKSIKWFWSIDIRKKITENIEKYKKRKVQKKQYWIDKKFSIFIINFLDHRIMLDAVKAAISGTCFFSIWDHIAFLLDWDILNYIQLYYITNSNIISSSKSSAILDSSIFVWFNEFNNQK